MVLFRILISCCVSTTLQQHLLSVSSFTFFYKIPRPLSKDASGNLHQRTTSADEIPFYADPINFFKDDEKVDVHYDETSNGNSSPSIVLVAGFESFNRNLYETAAREVGVNLKVFADSDIRVTTAAVSDDDGLNPEFKQAMKEADAFIGSLVFDYDDVLAVKQLCDQIQGPRFVFECATELMSMNKVGTFSMMKKEGEEQQPSGPPAPVKKILSLFSSGKEEDKISGYLKFLKIGPSLLQYVPGQTASDLKIWLETYRYWNQGGKTNVQSMLRLVSDTAASGKTTDTTGTTSTISSSSLSLPELQVTPDIGLIHPLLRHNVEYIESPKSYLDWRLAESTYKKAQEQKQNFELAPPDSPIVAILLYRKHVITEQPYLYELITLMEEQGVIPVPIFINGVEAHTIVRDLITSKHKIKATTSGHYQRDSTYQPGKAVSVDAIVNTIGFPLVGGPAGSIEAGRNIDVSKTLLNGMNVPYL